MYKITRNIEGFKGTTDGPFVLLLEIKKKGTLRRSLFKKIKNK